MTGRRQHDIIGGRRSSAILSGELVMDQLRKQVARARRRLIMEQFLGRLVWCVLGGAYRRRDRGRCAAHHGDRESARATGTMAWLIGSLALRLRGDHCVDVFLQSQPARCRHRNRSPLRPARTHRQQPVAIARRANERSRPRGRERRACAPSIGSTSTRSSACSSAAARGGRWCRRRSCLCW